MDKIKELKDKITILRSTFQSRTSKEETDKLYDSVLNDSTRELAFMGGKVDEKALLEKIIWRFERRNERLVEEERKNS